MMRTLTWISRHLFSRRLGLTVLSVVLILVAAVCVNVLGIAVVGNVGDWSAWLNHHRWHFLAWRLCVYGATAYGWWWMRSQVLRREAAPEARAGLRRSELSAVLAILTLECANVLQSL
jgi:hypothetical protein